MSAQVNVTQDFIFGTMATDELRLAAMAAEGRGVFHGNQISPTDPEPDQPVEVLVSTGTDVAAETVTLFYTLNGEDPSPSSPALDLVPGEVIWDTLLWGYRRIWRGLLPAQPEGVHVRYRIAAQGAGGEPVWAEPDPITGRPATFAYHVDHEHVPVWIRDAVIYHIFVDRFYPGEGRPWNDAPTFNDFWGGTLRGIIEQLPYLEDLGVTCLWLSPVFPSPSHHGYDATDYFRVEPRLGTDDDLRDLLALAHARGMRVLLDYVANHVSDEHPAFRRATGDPTAPERAWFTFGRWPEEYRSFFGVKSLPQIDNEHLAARRHIIDGARYWLEQGADGFRLDYANGPTHGFWTQFRAETRAVEPESFTVGEIVETAELQRSYQGRLDGVLDFLLLQQMRAFFAFDVGSPRVFDTFLRRHLEFFPTDFVLPSFLDNHDMNRFLWVVRGDTRRLRLAALCQMTLPYPPIVYYGTEVGLSQRQDLQYPDGSRRMEESRTPMPWGDEQDAELLAFYRRLIALRRAHGSLWRGRRVTLAAGDGGLLVWRIAEGAQQALVVLNRGMEGGEYVLPHWATMLDLATEPLVQIADGRLRLPPMAGALMLGGAPAG